MAQNLSGRVVHNDPSTYRELSGVHDGAGKMGFTQLIGRNDLSTNFLYLHTGIIHPKSGIGHHFHHTIEEMYVILDGEAEFTINGRTSSIQAPAIVPCKMGDSHGIYNTTGMPLKWLNFAVSEVKARGDAYDLADDRVGVELDETPVFVASRLEHDKLKSEDTYKGQGVLFRRVLSPEVFRTDWHHVDHVVIPGGSTSGSRQLDGVEEVYYVMSGSGSVTVGNQTATLKADDSFYASLGEDISWKNTGNENLELLVIGISASKKDGLAIAKPLAVPKAMVLQMDFVVDTENKEAFENMYYSVYVPAMTVQDGYLSSKLLRLFPDDVAKTIEAEPTSYNYQIQISFDTEENRRKWVASDQHQIAWPAATAIAREFKWRGYDVMGDDDQK
jgi:mannose-6-phosphate isomerase-like protein (cupin superfamily)/heme-degrading monooxygenase HmoA